MTGAIAALTMVLAAQIGGPRPASQCVTCHVDRAGTVPGATHVAEWQQSAHGRASVGCERCHGGNPAAPYVAEAHVGVINGRLPASPVHRTMLPRTCGSCHRGAFDAFRNSRHFVRLAGRDPRAPSCSTCHGAMAAQVPSPDTLAERCARCHGEGTNGSSSYASAARDIVAEANRVREDLQASEADVARVRDAAGRQRLMTLQMRAMSAMLDVAEALHAFDLPRARIRVQAARARMDEISRASRTRGLR